ncbi:MAG: cell envelope integrity protein CreD [Tannerellaceae bacterium]|jgi:inner membrane protein|nr:cell envelope integrity protein CreD [Tannerellaceae bacterium]
MEKFANNPMRFSASITVKAIIIAMLTIFMIIPSFMIRELISERQKRSKETIERINEKWSRSQTLVGPLLFIPYQKTFVDERGVSSMRTQELCLVPEDLSISARLYPEERHYGIYKTILYKSEISIEGTFPADALAQIGADSVFWDKLSVSMGVSDLRGLTSKIAVNVDGKSFEAVTGGIPEIDNAVSAFPGRVESLVGRRPTSFACKFNLNGSSSIDFVPVGKTTEVSLSGAWDSPSYIGDFSPEIIAAENGFEAKWSVLSFNRNIPDSWTDRQGLRQASHFPSFGVYLVEPVDHYQQNMRSAKYALLFIILTFVVFFFVELLTRKRIHPIQYLLVSAALIIFYTLLLSLSEQIAFGGAYLIASLATLSLITAYTYSIFGNKKQTAILSGTLSALYVFLYVTLRIEDIALLIGSTGLFLILAAIMYISRKVNWYKQDEI